MTPMNRAIERHAFFRELPNRLSWQDNYTYEELMADICTDEQPCDLCQRSMAKRNSAYTTAQP